MSNDAGTNSRSLTAAGESIGQQKQPKKRKRIKPGLAPIEGRLIRNPPPKAVAPYKPKSELEDASLRFLIHHCKYPATQDMYKADTTHCRCNGNCRTDSDMRGSPVGVVSSGCERSCLLQCPYLFDIFPCSISPTSRSTAKLLLSPRRGYSTAEREDPPGSAR